jgi:hypothetical protein
MAKRSKSKQSDTEKNGKSFKRGLIIAVLGFIVLAALWMYVNRDESIGGNLITIAFAAVGAALGLWLVYRLNYKK